MAVESPKNRRRPMMVHGVSRPDMRAAFRSRPMHGVQYAITGTTKDSTGAALGNCIVDLFYTATDTLAARMESDAAGAFSFLIGPSQACYIVAYKAGAPDVAGTTVNTLVAA